MLQWAAVRTGGMLSARFVRARTTGDAFDLPYNSLNQEVLVAYHTTDNTGTVPHSTRGRGFLRATPPTTTAAPATTGPPGSTTPPATFVAPPPLGRISNVYLGGAYRTSVLINSTHIDIAVSVDTAGWAAFGFRAPGVSGSMIGADIVFFSEPSPGVFECEDTYAAGFEAPQADADLGGVNSLIVCEIVRSSDVARASPVLQARFVRLVDTRDAYDLPFSNALGQEVLVALHETSNDRTQTHTARTRATLSGTSSVAATPDLVIVHAVLMVVAFPVLMMGGNSHAPLLPCVWHALTHSLFFCSHVRGALC